MRSCLAIPFFFLSKGVLGLSSSPPYFQASRGWEEHASEVIYNTINLHEEERERDEGAGGVPVPMEHCTASPLGET